MRGQRIPRSLWLLLLVTALAVLASLPATAFAQSAERIIVKRDPGLNAAERADLRTGVGARLVDVLRLPRTEVVTVRAGDADAALAKLNASPNVVYAERDELRSAFALPNDMRWPFLWGLSNTGQAPFSGTPGDDIHLLDAWSFSQGTGQTVGVVDSGIDVGHDDLAGQVAPSARNFVPGANPGDLSDQLAHGTHVSGTIAARANNAIGVVGVAPAARVLPLRVFGSTDNAFDSWIAQAFDYAGDLGVRVVNASFGSDGGPSLTLTNAIGSHPNTLYVTAAGNGGRNNDTRNVLPCEVPRPNVVCVGASDYDDRRASFSNYGATSVDLFAPGVDIMSTWPGDAYRYQDGTSMAAPHVSGEAALLLAAAPSLTTQELKALVLGSVDPRPGLSGVSVTGGRANAGAAVRALAGSDADADGVGRIFDSCPAVPGSGPDGCPVVSPPVAGTTAPSSASEGSVRPRVRSLRVRIRPKRCRRARRCRRRITIAIKGDPAARAKVRIERRCCSERRCRWRAISRRSVAIASGKVTVKLRGRRLARGSYRATVVVSDEDRAGPPRRVRFRVR